MKRRKKNCVCSCTPVGGITFMDPIVLNQMLNESELSLEAEANTRLVGKIALELGILCEQKGWNLRALGIWEKYLQQIVAYDSYWGDEDVPLPFPNVRISHLMAEHEAMTLGKRIDRLWKRINHPELANAKKRVERYYWNIWFSRYYDSCDSSYIEEMEARLGIDT